MPQPHAAASATTSHHQHHTESQSYNFASYNHPPRATSSNSRYPPPAVGPARARSTTPINFSQKPPPPAANSHYNRARSDSQGLGFTRNRSGSGHGAITLNTGLHPPTLGRELLQHQQPDETLYQPPLLVDETPPASPFFFAGALPRTSSLLPPPRNLGPAAAPASYSPDVNADNDFPFFLDPVTNSLRPFSRGSSTGAVSDSFRNLNRWSASTTSTIDRDQQFPKSIVNLSPQSTTNFSRRMSVDSVALRKPLGESPRSPTYQSPRRLTKRRPSAASISSVSPRSTRPRSPPPAVPPPNLPPIISLPSLDFSSTSTNNRSESPAFNRLSPAVGTPTSAFSSQAGGGPKDYFWDELTDPNSTSRVVTRDKAPTLLPPATVTREPAMPERVERKGHTRSRSSTTAKSSTDSGRGKSKQPSQKAMLSKALAKANTAVQLDNAQNYEGARSSYTEACDLLAQVLARTTGDEDKKKLEAIRHTYTSRIEELDGMVPSQNQSDTKALPARPESLGYNGAPVRSASDDEEDVSPTATRKPGSLRIPPPAAAKQANLAVESAQMPLQSAFSSRSPMRRNFEGTLAIPAPENGQLMPAPLSPRRPSSPGKPGTPESIVQPNFSLPAERVTAARGNGHTRGPSHESISWLDPIDESGGSAPSSVHSRTSSFGVRRKHIRAASGDTEAEFDAALDAAVEAAYDDGYEPMDSYDRRPYDESDNDDDVIANAMRRVQIAKERVRQSEREAQSERDAIIRAAREKERQRQSSMGGQNRDRDSQTYIGHYFDGNDSDEEERMLEDLTRDYALNNFSFNQQTRKQSNATARERESDSSGLTQRTWQSSIGSSPPTGTTALSSVAELPMSLSKPPSSSLPPPPQTLPQLPRTQPSNVASGVRSRRLSGQNPKQLKIETSKTGQTLAGPPATAAAVHSKQANYIAQQRQALSATSTKPGPFSMQAPGSPIRGISPAPAMPPPTPPRNPPHTDDPDDFRSGSPTAAGVALRKNQSSSSLKSLKQRQLSISHPDHVSDLSPNTPLSQTLTNSSTFRQPSLPALPTPTATTFGSKATGGFGGLYLFDSDFHSPVPHSPSSISQQNPDIPVALEPCPSDVMLRPFWLMRTLYQTLVHPRGGYITNRLFVPRDVWKVKGVKLRALEDKSSQCDFLTAALLNLARVDSTDADAVLEEMQSLENVLEQVQQALTRKLGSDVGTGGAGAFREREDGEPIPSVPRSASVSGRTAAFSWRRLRSKGSAVNLTSAYGNKSTSGGMGERIPERDIIGSGSGTLPSLPMVANPSSRPAKRDVASVRFDGPYAGYMQSLARLFDAAQAVDLIARQVDDPGLRHADKTQVGLELCTRHAAEFFGFYICRFVLADLGMLLDKFVKRGSEWVLT